MKFTSAILTAALFLSSSTGSSAQESKVVRSGANTEERELRGKRGGRSERCGRGEKMALKVINLTRAQPFARDVFVMVHNDEIPPLFEYGGTATEQLKALAENGDAGPLVALYGPMDGVRAVRVEPAIPPGATAYIDIDDVRRRYPYLTMAAMFVHSNDGFAAINGERVQVGDVLELNGIDAGTELNSENCVDIPGPACNNLDGDGNVIDNPNMSAGQDVPDHIRIHSGFFGEGADGPRLTAARYTWLNPMLRVEVVCVDEDMLV